MPACVSDLRAAATDLKRKRPGDFGDMGASSQAFGLFVFAYSCGTIAGPTVVGIIKAKVDWGAATLIMAFACAAACVPIVSVIRYPPQQSIAHRTCGKVLKTPQPSRKHT